MVKSETKRLLGRPNRRWENNIKMGVKKILREKVDWIHLPQGRNNWQVVVTSAVIFRVPLNAGNFLA